MKKTVDFEALVDLANNLTNEEACQLINIFSNRCDVYIGLLGNCCISSGISWAGMNGATIQINLELAENSTIADDEFVTYAIKKHNAEERRKKREAKS